MPEFMELTFECSKIVYPLKISSINSGMTEVLLYFFYEDLVHIPDFELEQARYLGPDDVDYMESLQPYVQGTKVLSKLRREMNPVEMDDIIIDVGNPEIEAADLSGGIRGYVGDSTKTLFWVVILGMVSLLLVLLAYVRRLG
jgi:hypothetical protein